MVHILDRAQSWIDALSSSDSAKLYAHLAFLECGEYGAIFLKGLGEKVRELRVGASRVIFVSLGDDHYVTGAFRKKTRKTPREEIDYAMKIHHALTNK